MTIYCLSPQLCTCIVWICACGYRARYLSGSKIPQTFSHYNTSAFPRKVQKQMEELRNTDNNNLYMTDNSDDNNETTLETYKTNWKTNTITNCNS